MYRIATIRNYYHGALGVNEAPEISDETYDTIAEAQAWINEQESSTYVLGNNESSRPDYYIIPVDVGDYLNRGRDGMDNYDWSDSECQHDDCGLCDDCIVMMAVQDREFVIKSAITQDDESEDTDQIEKQILDEINQQEGRNYQSVTFLSPDDYDKKYEYWGHPRQHSIDGDEFEIGQYCEIGEDEDTAELIACIFDDESEGESPS